MKIKCCGAFYNLREKNQKARILFNYRRFWECSDKLQTFETEADA
jgi:hypothetical protein